jgi:gamma-glutamyltranspeptidase / glutathione hydrolase
VLRGFTAQAALDAPRFCISPGMPDVNTGNRSAGIAGVVNSEVYFEEGISDESVARLRGESTK